MSFIGSEIATRLRLDNEPDIDPDTGLPEDASSREETTLTGTVNPMDGETLETLTEGDRASEGIELITKTELRTADEQAGDPPDYVDLRGKVYEVRTVVYYSSIIPHYEAQLVRKV